MNGVTYHPSEWKGRRWRTRGTYHTFAGAAFAAWMKFACKREPHSVAVVRHETGKPYETVLICK